MPGETPIYGLPFEVPADQPGITLHGGPSGEDDILAEKVEEQLERVDNERQALDDRVVALEEQVFQLVREPLTGTVGTGTDVVITPEYRGIFDSYVLEIDGHVSQSLRPLVVRVNGLADDNYRAVASAVDPADFSVAASSKLTGTSFPRAGFLGEFGALHRIILRPSTKGTTGFIQWVAHGWANEGGSDSFLTFSGGRWNGSVQEITHFTIRTAGSGSANDVWGSNSFATLWGRV